uniref:intelectin-1-like n=1 Tax=Pristiophorus japonicus TaxID=55135 RepID=UPI00398EC1A8
MTSSIIKVGKEIPVNTSTLEGRQTFQRSVDTNISWILAITNVFNRFIGIINLLPNAVYLSGLETHIFLAGHVGTNDIDDIDFAKHDVTIVNIAGNFEVNSFNNLSRSCRELKEKHHITQGEIEERLGSSGVSGRRSGEIEERLGSSGVSGRRSGEIEERLGSSGDGAGRSRRGSGVRESAGDGAGRGSGVGGRPAGAAAAGSQKRSRKKLKGDVTAKGGLPLKLGKYLLHRSSPSRVLPRPGRNVCSVHSDGIQMLSTKDGSPYHAFCDMTTSVHENNMYGKCTTGDRWSSQQGNDARRPAGDGSWSNYVTFGSTDGATSDDLKNPGYYDIMASDISVWHVPNDTPITSWRHAAILRYHTQTKFLHQYGGNLFELYKRYPVEYNKGKCPGDNGPFTPITYDFGDGQKIRNFYGSFVRGEFEPGFVQFRVFNKEKAALAMCSGMETKGCNSEHFCIGGGGYFPEESPRQCEDFAAFDWNGYSMGKVYSATKVITEAAVLIFYR